MMDPQVVEFAKVLVEQTTRWENELGLNDVSRASLRGRKEVGEVILLAAELGKSLEYVTDQMKRSPV